MNYLDAAIARAKLPIHVSFDPDCETLFVGRYVGTVFCIAAGSVYLDPAQATRAYLRLCASLDPGASIPPGTSDGCSVLSTPRGEL